MKICAIICEYNPFHSGHKYHMDKARRESGADAILCIMSGNFVQRAEPAIFDKYTRAKAALLCGADFVIELPTIYAVGNGQKFAEGAITILKRFKDVKYLAMGCEENNEKLLNLIADIQLQENEAFKRTLNAQMDDGNSYAAAYTRATVKQCDKADSSGAQCEKILSKPNNLLAIEYVKAIKKFNCDISPIFIKRKGNDYNSSLYGNDDYISATAARTLYKSGDYTTLTAYVPTQVQELFRAENTNFPICGNIYEALTVNALRNNDLSNLYDNAEGIAFKLKENALKFVNLDEILLNTKSKRYTYSRLKRVALQALLCISKDTMLNFEHAPSRLLGLKEDVRYYLGSFPENIIIQNNDYENASGQAREFIEIDKRASNIYSLLSAKNGNQFYTNRIITL